MDPIGFALESFDGIGHWRTAENVNIWNHYTEITTHTPLDTAGAFPDGSKFQGPAGLRTVLLSHSEQYVMTVTEKLLTYALGRGVEYYDEPTVRAIMRHSAGNDYRWSSLIVEIIKSAPFLMRTSSDPATTPQSAGRFEPGHVRSALSGGIRIMMIFKKSIPRRTVLRGMGTGLALPLLDCMVPALSAEPKSPVRLGIVHSGNGQWPMDRWTPKLEGAAFEMTPTLEQLTPYRNQLLVLSGLARMKPNPD